MAPLPSWLVDGASRQIRPLRRKLARPLCDLPMSIALPYSYVFPVSSTPRHIANNHPPAIFSVCCPRPRFTLRGLPVLNCCVHGDEPSSCHRMKKTASQISPSHSIHPPDAPSKLTRSCNQRSLTNPHSPPRRRLRHAPGTVWTTSRSSSLLRRQLPSAVNFLAAFSNASILGPALFGTSIASPKFHEVALLVHDDVR